MEQCGADSGLGFKVIKAARFVNQQSVDFRLPLRGGQRAEVDLLELERPAFVHHRHGFAVRRLNCGAQALRVAPR